MEFQDVVRRRRMVRRYTDEPVAPEQVHRIVSNAVRAPSAGFSQGWSFLVLDTPEDVARYWAIFADAPDAPKASDSPAGRSDNRWLAGMRTAPVLILPCSSQAAYLARYAESDKGGSNQDEARWSMPYWHMDTAMAVMLMLQTAVDEGLGACYFGIPTTHEKQVHATFGIPEQWSPIGVVSLGHPAPGGAEGSPSRRRRTPLAEVVHHGRWS